MRVDWTASVCRSDNQSGYSAELEDTSDLVALGRSPDPGSGVCVCVCVTLCVCVCVTLCVCVCV